MVPTTGKKKMFFSWFWNHYEVSLTALPHLYGLVHGPRDNVGMCPVEVNRSAKVGVTFQPLTGPLVGDVPHSQAFVV